MTPPAKSGRAPREHAKKNTTTLKESDMTTPDKSGGAIPRNPRKNKAGTEINECKDVKSNKHASPRKNNLLDLPL